MFVTGGTGAIVRPSVDALVEAGHQVTALARSREKARVLERQGASPVEISIFDRVGLAAAFVGHDAVVNLATALPNSYRFMSMRSWDANVRLRTQGSRAGRGPGRVALVLGDRTTSLTRSLRVANERFKGASSWTPRFPSAYEGWEATGRVLGRRAA